MGRFWAFHVMLSIPVVTYFVVMVIKNDPEERAMRTRPFGFSSALSVPTLACYRFASKNKKAGLCLILEIITECSLIDTSTWYPVSKIFRSLDAC
jgi:hypothetical protein